MRWSSPPVVNIEGKEKLIEIIKTARGSMSQRAFGKVLGVSATAVQLWEKGDTIPDTENLAKIAARSGYTLEDLLRCLEGKPLSDPSDLNQILTKIQLMPLSQVSMIVRAGVDRLTTAVDSLER